MISPDELEQYMQQRVEQDCLLRGCPDHTGQFTVVRGFLWLRQSLLESTQHSHHALRHSLSDQTLYRRSHIAVD